MSAVSRIETGRWPHNSQRSKGKIKSFQRKSKKERKKGCGRSSLDPVYGHGSAHVFLVNLIHKTAAGSGE